MRSREQEGARRRSGVSFFPNAADHKKPLRAVGSIRRKKASPRASVTVEAAIALPLYLFCGTFIAAFIGGVSAVAATISQIELKARP